ncbi:hypothetical protein HanRHA438_Chr05g0233911 [Helianthus annuus]|uniref:Uncharacterized protein n=1 Tax=Helianthus annuus TaxID=4232 RepID=A0A251UTC5_HELAN|nr:uncharacterized protein LOC110941865 [Helianthus annuus]KAF5806720.1 hypothetical protein HanXRQr2_Chr05g0224901 [Helianthus annuus]KAJ0585301.1 hypothetical protein HanHA89_Chr05g0198801 [Helianthus annuus]KAJ0919808.1 hypothetical protein HanRHA438_Chr05g0233911 [Helianthus annuus]
MGSLMAGWDSHVPDPKSVQLERNRSMTKEEIATFWKSKNNVKEEQEHGGVLKKACTFSEANQKNGSEKIYRRSNSLPIIKEDSIIETQEEEDEEEEELFKKHGWWINSRWAFLNEPPVIASETPSRYAAQFHVATRT